MSPTDLLPMLVEAERLFDQNRHYEAAALAEKVLQTNPDNARAAQVLGMFHSEDGKIEDAVTWMTRAIELCPDLAPTHGGLGRCYFLLGDLTRAMLHIERALYFQPDLPRAHFNRSSVWLKQERYRDGWIEYEWRWACGVVRPQIPRPRWDGAPLNGRSILIHTEQGLGDVLQFMRFLPDVRKQGRVVLACQKQLHALLRPIIQVDDWFPIDEPGAITFDVYAPLLSLPALLDIGAADIPRPAPYVYADAGRIEAWRPRIQALPGLKVGLCWQGSPTFGGDRHRSIPLAHYAPLAEIPGVTLISLQKGPGEEQIPAFRARAPMTVLDGLDRDAHFVDTAAIMQHLDLVITSDSAIAHVAGVLGRPVWVLLSAGCDWRWLCDRSDSPWYPTMRLFRQKTLGDWTSVLNEAAAALRQQTKAGA